MPTINLAVAASLVNGLPQAIAAFQTTPAGSGATFTIMYGGSDALAGLIVNPNNDYFDVFLSAGQPAVTTVQNAGMVETSVSPNPQNFIANTLVIVKNSLASSITINTFADVNAGNFPLITPATAHIWIANPSLAPAGQYAQMAFSDPTINTWSSVVYPKVIADGTMGSDVQVTLNSCLDDTLPAIAVVYLSDAVGKGLTASAVAPKNVNTQIVYPGAVLTNAANHGVVSAAQAFVTFLAADNGTNYFTTTKGFRPVGSTAPGV